MYDKQFKTEEETLDTGRENWMRGMRDQPQLMKMDVPIGEDIFSHPLAKLFYKDSMI